MSKTVGLYGQARKAMNESLIMTGTLNAGTLAMRNARTKYLPQEPGEPDEFYNARIKRTTLYNAFRKTKTVLAGKVFEKPITFDGDVNESFDAWLENIDLEGNDINQFGYEIFKKGLQSGVTFMMVDVPRVGIEKPTLKDEIDNGIRPYLISVDAEDLIGYRAENISGKMVLTQARIKETITISNSEDEFGEDVITQIRVIEPYRVRIYREDVKTKEWFAVEDITTTIPFVAVVPFYANKIGNMMGESPLLDLAFLNIEHWQKHSDLSNILRLTQVPILFGSGFSDDENKPITVGPNTFLKVDNEKAQLQYIEPTGNGVNLGLQSLQQLEAKMAALGASMLAKKESGAITATEKAISEGAADSDLAAIAKNFEDAMNLAIEFMGRIALMPNEQIPMVKVNTDYGIAGSGNITVDDLLKMRVAGEISRDTFFEKLEALTGLSFSAEEEEEKLAEEGLAEPEVEE